jgi:hypothetical protein
MTFTADLQPTKRRGRARLVSRSEVTAAWDCLRTAAEHGDVQASALLIALVEKRPLLPHKGNLAA